MSVRVDGTDRLGVLAVVAAVLTLAGCATAYRQGQSELRGGRPAEARRHFEEALAIRPDRLDALAGLAVAEYELGNFDRAVPCSSGSWPGCRGTPRPVSTWVWRIFSVMSATVPPRP